MAGSRPVSAGFLRGPRRFLGSSARFLGFALLSFALLSFALLSFARALGALLQRCLSSALALLLRCFSFSSVLVLL